jgi:UDP-N-acetylmuramoylalanine--D-glutamate ligase
VVGFGRSGQGAARLLLEMGVGVRVLEIDLKEEMRAAWERLAARGAEMLAGAHPPSALADCALVVRSPGIPADIAILRAARQREIPVISELAWAAGGIATPILAVTGTNGKSTTTAWAAHLLRHAGVNAVAAGNIGRSLSEAFLDEDEGATFVVEVSSFQLEDSPAFHPRAAAILNIVPDHLDRHGTFAAYAAVKWSLAANQEAGDLLILGPGLHPPAGRSFHARVVRCAAEDPGDARALFVRDGELISRSGAQEQALLRVTEISLPGPHNLLNAMAALALTSALIAEPARLTAGLTDFAGLPHRLESAGRVGGVRLVNDSKATNVESLRVALESFCDPVVLIAGGLDKGGSFEAIHELAQRRLRHLVAIGRAASRIRTAWPSVPSETADDLEAALRMALSAAGGEGVVLLSPGCASFDMFKDFEERGEVFKELVRKLAGEVGEGQA